MKLGNVGVSAEVMLGGIDGKSYQPIGTIFKTGTDFISAISVNIGLFRLIDVQVELNPPLDKGLEIIKSGKIGLGFTRDTTVKKEQAESNGETAASADVGVSINSIAVRISNGGVMSGWYRALLLNPELSISPSEIKITLQGKGILFDTKGEYVKGAHSGASREGLVRALLKDGEKSKVVISDEAKEVLKAHPVNDSPGGSEGEVEYAASLLREVNCIAVNKGANQIGDMELIHITTVEESRLKAKNDDGKTKSFVIYRQFDPSRGIFPILSFRTALQRMMFPDGALSSIQIGQHSSADKNFKSSTIGAGTYSSRASVVTSPNASIPEESKSPRMMPVPYRAESSIKDKLSSAVHSFIDRVFEYEIESLGAFDLLPGDPVRVEISDVEFLTGLFEVNEVEHTVSVSDGASTKFKCFRTGGIQKAISKGVGNAISAVQKKVNSENKTEKKAEKTGVLGD